LQHKCWIAHRRFFYCNSLLSGITDSLVQRLQVVQNAATCFVTDTCRCEHIMLVVRQLHWWPVWKHIEFKKIILVYKALNSLSLQYLMDDRTDLGDWSFTIAGPMSVWFWTKLLKFRQLPKTHVRLRIMVPGDWFLDFLVHSTNYFGSTTMTNCVHPIYNKRTTGVLTKMIHTSVSCASKPTFQVAAEKKPVQTSTWQLTTKQFFNRHNKRPKKFGKGCIKCLAHTTRIGL